MSTRFPLKSKLTAAVLACVLLVLAAPASAAQQSFNPPIAGSETAVSDRDWNQFIFPEKVVRGPYFPDSAPIPAGAKPVWLAGNTQFLLQVQRGAAERFQMVVETESGAVYKLYLKPSPIAGITYRFKGPGVAGAPNGRHADQPAAEPGRGADVELLRRVVQGDVPAEFEASKLPAPVRFDTFTAVPLTVWAGAGKRIAVFNLVASGDKSTVVAPPQFYRPGVTAVLLDGDHVGPGQVPTLYILETVSDE